MVVNYDKSIQYTVSFTACMRYWYPLKYIYSFCVFLLVEIESWKAYQLDHLALLIRQTVSVWITSTSGTYRYCIWLGPTFFGNNNKGFVVNCKASMNRRESLMRYSPNCLSMYIQKQLLISFSFRHILSSDFLFSRRPRSQITTYGNAGVSILFHQHEPASYIQ